jgi:hypothetical protein
MNSTNLNFFREVRIKIKNVLCSQQLTFCCTACAVDGEGAALVLLADKGGGQHLVPLHHPKASVEQVSALFQCQNHVGVTVSFRRSLIRIAT